MHKQCRINNIQSAPPKRKSPSQGLGEPGQSFSKAISRLSPCLSEISAKHLNPYRHGLHNGHEMDMKVCLAKCPQGEYYRSGSQKRDSRLACREHEFRTSG